MPDKSIASRKMNNRIGQDLHDSLGHTFAMLSVKTDLALQLFSDAGLSTGGKGIKRNTAN